MLKDIRFSLRQLIKQPAFTAIAVLTIALAIGATTAVLSLVNGLFVRPLPYRDPERLVLLLQHFDAATFALVTVLLGAVALAAGYPTAMRATKADPMVVLGHNT
jgi:hypothetical protein